MHVLASIPTFESTSIEHLANLSTLETLELCTY